MNLRLFQELMELNLAFEQVIHGLQRMEKVRLFHTDIVRCARADVESARVDANREFFHNFDEFVEDDAVWAYKFQREYNKKIKDPYLTSISKSRTQEERRKKKGLPPRRNPARSLYVRRRTLRRGASQEVQACREQASENNQET